jgi:hypothetical protein
MRHACDFGEAGKSTSARTPVNRGSHINAAAALADVMVDALDSEASRAAFRPCKRKLA